MAFDCRLITFCTPVYDMVDVGLAFQGTLGAGPGIPVGELLGSEVWDPGSL